MTTPPLQPADTPNPDLALWQQAFDSIVHPGMTHMLDALIEMENCLAPAVTYLEGLDADDKEQAALGIAVVGFALDYADRHLDHFGLWDGPPAPKPATLTQAKTAVSNVLTFVRGWIVFYRQELAAQHNDEDDDDSNVEEAPAPATPQASAPPPAKPTIKEGTFEIAWKDKTCLLGNGMEFKVFEFLLRRPGFYYSTANLQEAVWGHDSMVEKNTIQRTVSNLRKKLTEAGMIALTIDGSQRDHYALKIG